MKRLLLGTTALIAAAAMAGTAQAADKIRLSVSGYGNFAAAYVDQDVPAGSSLREFGYAQETEVHFKGTTTLDNGIVVGFRAELELDRDETSGTLGSADLIDEVYFHVTTGFGEIQVGSQDGIGDQFGVFSPIVSQTSNQGTRVNDSEIYFFQTNAGGKFRPVPLRTDLSLSDDNLKMIYMTPRLAGFQLGVSYMPEPTKGYSGFSDRRDNESEQGDILEAGVNYNGKFDMVSLKAYAAYVTGSSENGTQDDLEDWGAGVQVKFAFESFDLAIGGSYRDANAGVTSTTSSDNLSVSAVDDNIDSEIWDAGVVVSSGPWSLGANYITGETADAGTNLEGTAWEVDLGYAMGPGINLTLGYQNWNYERDSGTFSTVSGTDEADADVVYLEFAFST